MTMRLQLHRVAVLVVCLGSQACVAPPSRVIDPLSRVVAGGREVVVIVPQGEITAAVTPSNIAASTGGGLIPALIDVAITQSRVNSAEAAIGPLRNALGDYDFDRSARSTLEQCVSSVSWLDVKRVDFTKDASKDSLMAALDRSAAPQVLVARLSYGTATDFAEIFVTLNATIFPKDAAPGKSRDSRIDRSSQLYSQTFRFVEALPPPAKDDKRNVEAWSSDAARKAKATINAGLSEVCSLLVRSLSQTPEAAAALDKGRSVTVAHNRGNLVESSGQGVLIFQPASATWVFANGATAPAQ